jgi:hypothetical protein
MIDRAPGPDCRECVIVVLVDVVVLSERRNRSDLLCGWKVARRKGGEIGLDHRCLALLARGGKVGCQLQRRSLSTGHWGGG